jgi:hypothetical protein
VEAGVSRVAVGLITLFGILTTLNAHAESVWDEVLPSREWCTVSENGQPVIDLAQIYTFTAKDSSHHFVGTLSFTANGQLPVQIDDVGMWSAEGDQLLIQTTNQEASFTIRPVARVDAAKKPLFSKVSSEALHFALS